MKKYNETPSPSSTLNRFYLVMNLSFALLLPAISVMAEHFIDHTTITWHLAAKWLIFWGAGMRLFTAGIKQAATPEFTAINIFKMKGKESYVVIRELGFANISLGIMGILSVLNDSWRMLAAIATGIFFGFAAMQHCTKKPCSANEKVALAYDAVIFLSLLAYLFSQR
jgi:hypothetical protein